MNRYLEKKSFFICLLFVALLPCLPVRTAGAAVQAERALLPLPAELRVEILPEQGLVKVRAKLTIDPALADGGRLQMGLSDLLRVTGCYDEAGLPLECTRDKDGVSLQLPPGATATPVPITLEYEGNPSQGSQAYVGREGCFASWLSGWLPYVDGMAGFSGENTFVVPATLFAASQGKLLSQVRRGESMEFRYRVRQPTYYSFAVAPFEFHRQTLEGIEYSTFFLSGGREKSDHYIGQAGRIIAALQASFGRYPYDGFGLVELPVIPSLRLVGCSEQGLVVLPRGSVAENDFNFSVIAHEIGHVWWGNWVIGETFVLSEGLAQLGNFLAAEAACGPDAMRKYALYGTPDHFSSVILYLGRFADGGADEPPLETMNFSYEDYIVMQGKGPMVFLMLRDLIGPAAFARGFAAAARTHAHARMTMKQLQREFEAAAGTSLEWFFAQWVQRPGAPVLEMTWSTGRSGTAWTVSGSVRQTRPPYYKLPIELEIATVDGRRHFVVPVQGEESPFRFTVAAQPLQVELDPLKKSLWIGEREKGRKQFSHAMSFAVPRAEGVKILEDAVRKDPGDFLSRSWIALFELRRDPDSEKALAQLEAIVANCDPAGEYDFYYAYACYELARMSDRRGEHDKAAGLFNKLAAVDRRDRYRLLIPRGR